jgi:hypothetical protein
MSHLESIASAFELVIFSTFFYHRQITDLYGGSSLQIEETTSIDIFLLETIALLFLTITLVVLYHQRLKRVGREYVKAKNVIGEVIISFDKQIQRLEDHIKVATYKTEVISESAKISRKLEERENCLNALVPKVSNVSEMEERVKIQLDNMQKRIDDVVKVQSELEQRLTEVPEIKNETVIPIKRERALAPLTETELRVLEIIADGSAKTAPVIKNSIKLTREHTARLVRKLYEEGYLERETESTPYKYRVKEEMLRILKKVEHL